VTPSVGGKARAHRERAGGANISGHIDEPGRLGLQTIYRDVESLSAAGVPVYADRGPAGGYRLLDGYRTRLTGLTAEEARSLFLAGMPGPAAELGLGTVLAAAELKLMAALPKGVAEQAGRVRERFLLDVPGWFHGGDPTPFLAEVADAVWTRHRLCVRYRRWKTPTPVARTLDPLGLVLLTPAVIQAARQNAGEPDGAGWVRTVIPIESVRHAHAELMRFGEDVEVIEPAELRDRMAASARAVLALYGG
jgi:predicted DNA-binding transcriptional regulator YafY